MALFIKTQDYKPYAITKYSFFKQKNIRLRALPDQWKDQIDQHLPQLMTFYLSQLVSTMALTGRYLDNVGF